MKYGKKQFPVDENRRDTYGHSLASGHVQTILDALEGERKELMPVFITITVNLYYFVLNGKHELLTDVRVGSGEGFKWRIIH